MKWVFIIVGVVVGLGVLMMLVGLMLPRNHVATSELELRKPIDSVWAVVRDLGNSPTYWTDLKSSSRLPDVDGKEAWGQTTKDGFTLPLVLDEDRPPTLLVTRIGTTDGPFGGTWRYQLESVNGGTRITITEAGWVSNPMFRVISKMMGHHGTIDSYLKALSKKFGETAAPTHREDNA